MPVVQVELHTTVTTDDHSPEPVEPTANDEYSANIPDGGYGWTIVLNSAILTFWINGTSFSWGVIQAALFDQGLSTASTLSWLGSLSITFNVSLALLSNRVIRILGARWCSILGVTLIGLGELSASWTTHKIGGLFGTTGVLQGLGGSLLFMLASNIPAQYFSSKLGLANGIVKAAGGLGAASQSLAANALIEKFGIAWAFRILGLAMLVTGLPAAWFMRERQALRRSAFVDFAMFRSLPFCAVFLAGAIGTFALFVPTYYLPLFARSQGLPATTGAWLVAGFNLCATVGRLVSGVLCDKLGPFNTFMGFMLLNAVCSSV